MTQSIKEQYFWESAWQKAADRSRSETPAQDREPGRGPGQVARWDRMAKDFARRTGRKRASRRRDETIARLVEKGILTPRSRVLDIGAGPGSWALPMARRCARVTALEPSAGMVEILNEKIRAEGADNIFVDQRTWQAADLGQSGWEGAFDLVFASMTPGVDGPAALRKMIAASRGWCYLSAFSGPGMHRQYAPLWEKFFGRPMPETPNDIIFPFNLLYAMGFRPDLTFSWWDREINWNRDETVRHFTAFFESRMAITPEAAAMIADYVDTRCPDGEYRPEKPVCRGAMIWDVRKHISRRNQDET